MVIGINEFFFWNDREEETLILSFFSICFLLIIVFTVGGFHFHIAIKKWPMLPGWRPSKIRVVVKVPLDWSNTLPCKRNFSKQKKRDSKIFVKSMAPLWGTLEKNTAFYFRMKIIIILCFFLHAVSTVFFVRDFFHQKFQFLVHQERDFICIIHSFIKLSIWLINTIKLNN